MNKSVKIAVECALAVLIVLVAWLTVRSVQKPVKFNKEVAARSQVAIQRLKDIRTLQVAFKSETGHFSPTMDSLKMFYESGKMAIVMQIGSMDDSLAVVNTEAIKKAAGKKAKPEEILAKLQEAYQAGTPVVYSVTNQVPVKDTLFNNRPDFCIDSLAYTPFSGGAKTEMESTIRGPYALQGSVQGSGQPAPHQPGCRTQRPEQVRRPAGG